MTIRKFTSFNALGIFRDFHWPSDLPEFSTYNLVYGYNWSGKSTLTNLLRAIEKGSVANEGVFRIQFDDQSVNSNKSHPPIETIKVFNSSFINDSVFSTTSDQIAGIYIIGETNVRIAREIENLRTQLQNTDTLLTEAKNDLAQAEDAKNNHGTTWSAAIRTRFLNLGLASYNAYNRTRIFQDLTSMETANTGPSDLSFDEIQRYEATLSTDRLESISLLPEDILDISDTIRSTESILNQTPIAVFSQRITANPDIGDWINEGFTLHKEHGKGRCLYCQQVVPKSVVDELTNHFNDDVSALQNQIDDLVCDIRRKIDTLIRTDPPDSNSVFVDLREDLTTSKRTFSKNRTTAIETLRALDSALKGKRSEINKSHTLDLSEMQVCTNPAKTVNDIIRQHNLLNENLNSAKKEAEHNLRDHLVFQHLSAFKADNRAIAKSSREIQKVSETIRCMEVEIKQLNLRIDNYSMAAANLTLDLRDYLGHADLSIAVQDDNYTITRAGQLASDLSDGEKSAIALLYFLHSLTADDIDPSDLVVVLDDPVTSMDTNSMINAVSFIRNRMPEIGQLLIFTHDFNFTKEVIKWYRSESKRSQRQFYMIEVTHSEELRSSSLIEMDSKLIRFDSEYHYLFDQVKRCSEQRGNDSLSLHHYMPNVMRRVIESFTGFKYPSAINTTTKFQRLRNSGFSKQKIDAIESFTNSFSHGIDAGGQDPDPLRYHSAPQMAQDVLDLIKHIDEAHFVDMQQAILNSERDQQYR